MKRASIGKALKAMPNEYLITLAFESAQIRVQIPGLLLTSYMPLDQTFHLCKPYLLVSF